MIWTISLAVKSTLVLGAAAVTARALRRSSASSRHTLWSLALLGLVALPGLGAALPRLELPLLRTPTPAVGSLEAVAAAVDGPPAVTDSRDTLPARLTWGDGALLVWLAGVGLLLLQLAFGSLLVALAVRRSKPAEGPGWKPLLDEATSTLGVRGPVELRVSDAADVPHVWGYWSPVVLFPRASETWPEERKRSILLHELAHVARHDLSTQTLAHVARAFYWPHPLAWWAVTSLLREAECACDDRVLHAGTEAPDYARHLLEAARGLVRPAGLLTASAGAEGTRLGDRVRALLDEHRNRRVPTRHATGLVGAVTILAVAVLAAAEPVTPPIPDGPPPQGAAEARLSRLIVHEPVGCLIEGRNPEMEAVVASGFEVDEVRLYFSGPPSDEPIDYWIEMAARGERFVGRLPRPTSAANPVHYRVEVRGTDGRVASTERYVAVVAARESLCPEGARIAPGASSSDSVTVHTSAVNR